MDEGPTHIGPYRVLSLLGEGGMGAVYAAEQRQPIDRRVAVKVVKVGMDTKEVLARFDVERKALALLDHPNIARILDAGATPEGRPYFAMELVRGQPITRYCDANRMSLEQRVRLLRQACNAIQHAHDRGILHRDIKPSNLLVAEVDGEPYVKVIDFGLAKAVNQRLTERTLFTEEGRILGTIEYMSPEQADLTNQDIDHRADVYSLGAVLYELVAGVLPFDSARLRSRGLVEMQRAICEVDPPTPSKRLTELRDSVAAIAGLRQCALRDLRGALRRGLDAVVMKAMAKRRSERYASCRELAADLERFLAGGSVQLGFGWRSRQLGRRAMRAVTSRAGIALVALLVVAGTAAYVFLAISGSRYQDMLRDRDDRIRELNLRIRAEREKEWERYKKEDAARIAAAPGGAASISIEAPLALVTRRQWGAAPPKDVDLTAMLRPERITLHHSAIGILDPGLEATKAHVSQIQHSHVRSNGYGDIGYHYLIDVAGRLIEGRSIAFEGAHAGGDKNEGNIGVCLLGNFMPGSRGQEPSPEQLSALRILLEDLRARHGISRDQVLGHNELKITECPGTYLIEWLKEYRSSVAPAEAQGGK